jgi:hypothetical protein
MVLVCLFYGVGTTWNKHTKIITKKPMTVHYSDMMSKHVELETFQEIRMLYIQLDLNKTYVTQEVCLQHISTLQYVPFFVARRTSNR